MSTQQYHRAEDIVVTLPKSDFTPFPIGATLVRIVEIFYIGNVSHTWDGQTTEKPTYLFVFENLDDPACPTLHLKTVVQSFGKQSALARIAAAAGHPLVPGQKLGIDKLLGAQIIVTVSESKNVALNFTKPHPKILISELGPLPQIPGSINKVIDAIKNTTVVTNQASQAKPSYDRDVPF